MSLLDEPSLLSIFEQKGRAKTLKLRLVDIHSRDSFPCHNDHVGVCDLYYDILEFDAHFSSLNELIIRAVNAIELERLLTIHHLAM